MLTFDAHIFVWKFLYKYRPPQIVQSFCEFHSIFICLPSLLMIYSHNWMKVCCFFGNGNSRPNSGSILLMHCYYWRIVLLKFFGTISWFGSGISWHSFLVMTIENTVASILNCFNYSWELSYAAIWCNVWDPRNQDLFVV